MDPRSFELLDPDLSPHVLNVFYFYVIFSLVKRKKDEVVTNVQK
jgi:hypothetical protein